ncbi:MAG: META domain-containing protein [Spirochaetaceae bacterium]|jgi:hypothetical protein|nr:META domain-containing protein [Spirochaetaceae bacterium]
MRGFKTWFCRWALVLPLLGIVFCNCKSLPKTGAADESAGTELVEDAPAVVSEGVAVSEDTPHVQVEAENAQLQYSRPQYVFYEDLLDITWQLSEIRIGFGRTEFDRRAMAENNMGDVYTLKLTQEGISGKAAPNRYFSTYELQQNHDFRLRPIVGTLMAANINIGGIMESEYYWYLQHTTHWEIVNNGLELYAYPSQNEEIVLRYLRQ